MPRQNTEGDWIDCVGDPTEMMTKHCETCGAAEEMLDFVCICKCHDV